MKETDYPIVDMPTIRWDLYLVMSLLLADKAVVKVPDVVVWTEVFHENEVGRLMLWVATAMRGLLDLLDKSNKFNAKICGEYWADFPSGDRETLNI